MNEKPNLKNEERVELQGALNEFRQALEDEIRKIKSSGLFAKKRKERESAKAKPISNKKSSTSKKKSNSNRNSIKKPLNSENSSSNITNKMQVDQIRLF